MSFLAPLSTASPTPSNASSNAKRKRPTGSSTPAALPAENMNGVPLSESATQLRSQMHFAIQRLKTTDQAVSFQDLVDYLSIRDNQLQTRLQMALRLHESIDYDTAGFNGKGSYRYKPKHNVRTADELKGLLQRQKVSLGISAKELKDGWPGAWNAIDELEKKGDILVVRNKKEQTPKTVWHNDPSLSQDIDHQFRDQWHKIALPANPDELRSKLEAAGLKPTSAPREVAANKMEKKKKKTNRKSGRQTNTHMTGILKDYSHKRK